MRVLRTAYKYVLHIYMYCDLTAAHTVVVLCTLMSSSGRSFASRKQSQYDEEGWPNPVEGRGPSEEALSTNPTLTTPATAPTAPTTWPNPVEGRGPSEEALGPVPEHWSQWSSFKMHQCVWV